MYRILVLAILSVGAVFLGLTFVIVGNKAWREGRERWRRLRRSALEPKVLAHVHRGEASLLALLGGWVSRADRAVLEEILLSHIERVRGVERERLRRSLDELGYVDRYMAALRSPRSWRRAQAAEKLGLAGANRSTEHLVAALEDDSPEVRMRAAKALGAVGGTTAMRLLVQALSEPSRWSTIRVADILTGMGPEVVDELVTSYPELDLDARIAVLDILGRIRALHVAPWLRERLGDGEPDVRARACHALGAIGDPEAGPWLRPSLEDPKWPVRAMAAKALGRIRQTDAIPDLSAAMRDREWWVRSNAAQALRQMGSPGLEAITRMLDDPDRYARHQAVLMLEDSGVVDQKVSVLARPEDPAYPDAESLVQRFIATGQLSRLTELASTHRDNRVRRVLSELLAAPPAEGATPA